MEYKLPEETINLTLAYLGKQPYEEVVTIIEQIKANAKPVEDGTIKAENKRKKQ